MSIICTVCGAENMEGSIYCEDCGARLPAGAAATAAAPAPMPAPPPPPPPAPPVPQPTSVPAPAAGPTAPTPPAPAAAGGTVECEACGAANPAGEAYCEDCGAALPGSAQAQAPAVSIPDTPPVVDTPPPAPVAPVTPEPPRATPPAAHPKLLLAEGGQEFLLDKDTVNIGRRSPVDGIFPEVDLTDADKDSYISRRHGKLIFKDGDAFYEDLGSSNGSFLNGSRLQSGIQAVVKDGDRLRLGKTELLFKSS